MSQSQFSLIDILAKILSVLMFTTGLVALIPNAFLGNNGFFEIDRVTALLHIVLGVGLFLAVVFWQRKFDSAFYSVGFFYLLLAMLGFMFPVGDEKIFGFITANAADSWLYLSFGSAALFMAWWDEEEHIKEFVEHEGDSAH